MMLPEQPLRATRSRGVTPQLVLGVMVIVIGVLMTLDNLELIQAERYLRFWPVGLVALGLAEAVARARMPRRVVQRPSC